MSETIKEVTDELGISKDKVKYQVRKLTVKKSGVTYLDNKALSIIKDNLQGSVIQIENKNSPSDFLREQIAKSAKLLTKK
ncbi:hypothetical protein CKN80_03760 [Carnobacterium divergens]|uniref:hypothetical protein n=1 Tax=Carnobacterium divergens TaxID=2748 RepID=UPI001071F507|nr:hypothetical protein [Carnobacterium divergens]TFJ46863.1 hypothetical protein CKN79_03755 [Carnobacterium divergens]TFJ53827.1 hypothetical protein CKN80_03760 [Carnobacterium divergens]